jgi:hypothetical protein
MVEICQDEAYNDPSPKRNVLFEKKLINSAWRKPSLLSWDPSGARAYGRPPPGKIFYSKGQFHEI